MAIGIAIVGSGFMGSTHAHAYYKGHLDAEVRWLIDRNQTRAESLAASLPQPALVSGDLRDALRDPAVDAIDICVPTPLHHELVLQVAAAGKHVLCEKPIALEVEQAEEMIAACRTHGVLFMVAHVLRFWPEYMQGERMVREGRIGKLRHVACTRLSAPATWADGQWISNVSTSGGAVYDLAIHDYDIIRWLAGMPLKVQAAGDMTHFTAVFRMPEGVNASVEASFNMPMGYPFRMAYRLLGEEGVIEFNGAGGSLLLVTNNQAEQVPVEGSRTFNQGEGEELDGYFYEIEYFLDCVRNGRQPERALPENARDALSIARQVEQALKG